MFSLDTLSELSSPAVSSVATPTPSSSRDKQLSMLADQMLGAMQHSKKNVVKPKEPSDSSSRDSKVDAIVSEMKKALKSATAGDLETPPKNEKLSKESRTLPLHAA